jgi:hypothetical protein
MHSDIRPREPLGQFVDGVLTRRTEILTGCRWVEAHLLPRCQGHRPQRQFPVKAGLFASDRDDDRLEARTRSGIDEEMCSMTLLDYLPSLRGALSSRLDHAVWPSTTHYRHGRVTVAGMFLDDIACAAGAIASRSGRSQPKCSTSQAVCWLRLSRAG